MMRTLGLPLQLLAVIIFVSLFGSMFSPEMVRFFFTISALFKELLGLLLPFLILSFIMSGILSLKKNAPAILMLLLGCVFLSNTIVAMLSYLFVSIALPIESCPAELHSLDAQRAIEPYISFAVKSPISPKWILVTGVLLGILFSIYRSDVVERAVQTLKGWVEKALTRFFIPLLPVYVFGYLLEIHSRGILTALFNYYGNAILLIVSMQLLFIFTFFVLAKTSFIKGWQAIKNAFPSYVTALSTISSTATIPVSVDCAEKNTGNRPLADMCMPILANVHLMGASINIPVLSLATLILFKAMIPTPMEYITFVFYFCTSMFAVSGIPGAGLMVMLPLLIDTFSFSHMMISVLTALYLLLDALSAATNVMGDGALIIILNRLIKRLNLH